MFEKTKKQKHLNYEQEMAMKNSKRKGSGRDHCCKQKQMSNIVAWS